MSAENEKFAANNEKLERNVNRLEVEVDKMTEVRHCTHSLLVEMFLTGSISINILCTTCSLDNHHRKITSLLLTTKN